MISEYTYAFNASKLGELSVHYGSGDCRIPLHPAFLKHELESEENKLVEKPWTPGDPKEKYNLLLEPGLFNTPNKRFYPCPMVIFYVQIDKIIISGAAEQLQFRRYGGGIYLRGIELHLKIFDKTFDDFREEIIYCRFDLYNISDIVNQINRFIHNDGPLDLLNTDLLPLNIKALAKDYVLHQLTGLTVKSETFSRMSKPCSDCDPEEVYWTKAVVTNLPTDKYLLELTKQKLVDYFPVNTVNYSGGEVTINYSDILSTKLSCIGSPDEKNIKNNLCWDISSIYDSDKHFVSSLMLED